MRSAGRQREYATMRKRKRPDSCQGVLSNDDEIIRYLPHDIATAGTRPDHSATEDGSMACVDHRWTMNHDRAMNDNRLRSNPHRMINSRCPLSLSSMC